MEVIVNMALRIIAGVLAFASAGSGITKLVQPKDKLVASPTGAGRQHQRDSAALLWQVSPRSSVYHRGLAPSCPI
jgi:hypothetical protein